MSRLESFLLGLGCGFIILSSAVIVDTARQYEPTQPRAMVDHRPDIAQCDKPLWDRIRNGCDE